MYDTAEMRWILPGGLPAAVDRWFRADRDDHGRRDIEPEARTDRYVVMPGCETVGIKLRGAGSSDPARVDVKARRGDATELRLTPAVSGRVAAWSKWTLGLADHRAIVSGLEPPTPVLAVHKRRLLRRYVVDGDRTQEVPSDEDADGGCDLELTAITVDGVDGAWWSLGLEAFGPAEGVRETLQAVGEAWFEARAAPPLDPPQGLDGRSSRAYPAWLLERLAEAGRGTAGDA